MAREQRWPQDSPQARSIDERILGAARDKIVRNRSVANDIRLNLPVSIQRLDEEARPTPNPRGFPSGYDSRTEIQRPYVRAPPNKTIFSIPESDCLYGSSSHGPTNSKSSSSSSGSGTSGSSWSLNWNRSSNKGPPSHSRHRHPQHNPNSSDPSTSTRPNPSKQHKSLLSPQSGVFSSLFGGVTEKGDVSQCKEGSHDKSAGFHESEESYLQLLSDRKPANNHRTSPLNVNSSSVKKTSLGGEGVFSSNNYYPDSLRYNSPLETERNSPTCDFLRSPSNKLSSPEASSVYSLAVDGDADIHNARRRGNSGMNDSIHRKREDSNGNKPTASLGNVRDGYSDNACHHSETEGLDGNTYSLLYDEGEGEGGGSSQGEYHSNVGSSFGSVLLRESIQETGQFRLSETSSQLQDNVRYFTAAADLDSSCDVGDLTSKHCKGDRRGGVT